MTSILLSSWVSRWSMLRSMILVLVVPGSSFPANSGCCSLQKGLLGCVRSLLGHKLAVVAKGVKSATAPAETAGQGKWASKTSKEQQSVEVVNALLACGAGLGFEQCTAGWIEAFEEFLMATGVEVAAWCCHPCPMLGPSWVCCGGAGGLGSVKATAMARAVAGSAPVSSKMVKQCATAVSWS